MTVTKNQEYLSSLASLSRLFRLSLLSLFPLFYLSPLYLLSSLSLLPLLSPPSLRYDVIGIVSCLALTTVSKAHDGQLATPLY